jgi:hypothetical protein
MDTYRIERLSQVGGCLLSSALVGFFLYGFAAFHFDEMHIISTDYELKPDLTLAQVVRDVLLTSNICAGISAVIVSGLCLAALRANMLHVSHRSEATKKFAAKLAIGCWLIINAGVCIAALQYVAHIALKIGY